MTARDFSVRHNPEWHFVDLAGDPHRWAKATVITDWERSGAKPPRGVVKMQTEVLASLPTDFAGYFMVMVHMPEPWKGIGAIAAFATFAMEDDFDIAESMKVAIVGLEGPALSVLAYETAVVESNAGPAHRLWCRYAATSDGALSERLFYILPLAEDGMLVTVSSVWTDLAKSAEWQDNLDRLVRGATVD